jgi:NhaP-type Na+/H+ or K+/H+ antiporter
VSTDQVLTGIALIVVLAVGCQLLAGRLRVPALILLLPAGFTAGALTSDVNPEKLLGPAFQPLVSLSVAVILYDAGLGLDLSKLTGHTRRVVIRLIALGVPVTCLIGAACAAPLLGMSGGAALELGAILVVSGPTVVGPLLAFVRPAERLRRVLAWEGSLIDPVGATLGAVVLHAVLAGHQRHLGGPVAQFAASIGVGLAGGAVGAALLWLLLRGLRLGEVLGTSAQLAVVVAVAAACDVAREDSGLLAAIVIGLAMANTRSVDIPARRPFFETLVQLIIGLLFVSISATVTPASLHDVVLPALGLAAILVAVARPLVVLISTARTDLKPGERAFAAWMAPRGIVAAATASTFSASLAAHGIGGASKILPTTFVVIVATVALYGLTAVPVARRLGVMGSRDARPLIVGGDPWVVELATALRSAGVDVLMWAGLEPERQRISQAGLELAPGELLADATGSGAELEGVTVVLLLTREDDFNALAATILGTTGGVPVCRLAPPQRSHGVVAPFMGGDVLFGEDLTRPELIRRQEYGARIITLPAGQPQDGYDLLFVVRQDGSLEPVTAAARPDPAAGDTSVLMGRAEGEAAAPRQGSSRTGDLLPGPPEGA